MISDIDLFSGSKKEREKFLNDLKEFLGLPKIDNRLRPYHINVIGSGNIGRPVVRALAIWATENDYIKSINWWTRQKPVSNEFTSDKMLFNDLKTEINCVFSDHKNGNRLYDTFMEKVKVIGYDSTDKLKDIVTMSQKHSRQNEGDLTTILIAPDTKFMYHTNDAGTITGYKTRDELMKLGDSAIQLNANTLFNAHPEKFEACLETIIKNQPKVHALFDAVKDYTPGRIRLFLVDSLVGNKLLAQTLEGYEGTILNMSSPVEIINHQFASHSNIPVNRIFAPVENDFCRLQVMLKDIYNEYKEIPFKGEIPHQVIVGNHDEEMMINRNKILFNDKSFYEVFKNYNLDEVFKKVLTRFKNFGIDYFNSHDKNVAPDTTYNSVLRSIIMIINEESSQDIRGVAYDNDYQTFVGNQINFKRGFILPKTGVMTLMDSISKDLSYTFHNSIMTNKTIIDKLKKVDNEIFGKYEFRMGEVPQLEPEKDMVFDEKKVFSKVTDKLIENGLVHRVKEEMEKPIKNIEEINFTAYLISSKNSRRIHQYSFRGKSIPENDDRKYQFMIPDKNILDARHESERTKLISFGVDKKRLVMLAVREYDENINTFYINEYNVNNGTSPISYKNFEFRNGENIESLILNNNVYLLMNGSKGQNLSLFDGEIRELCKSPKDFKGIIPYKESIIGYTGNEYYKFDTEGKRFIKIYHSKKSNIGRVSVDSNNNILYYTVYDPKSNNFVQNIVAQDLDKDRHRILQSDPNGFDHYSDKDGIQFWATTEDAIRISDFHSKDELFSKDIGRVVSKELLMNRHYIQKIKRDVANLYHEDMHKLLLKYDGKLQIITLDALKDCQQIGVFL